MSDIDVLADAAKQEADSQEPASLEAVRALGARLIAVELELEQAETQVSALKKEREELRVQKMPQQMVALGLTVLGLDNHLLTLTPLIQGSLPKDPEKRNAAIEWLEDHGHSGIIKRQLTIDFPKGDATLEDKALEALEEVLPSSVPMELAANVHHATYSALCRKLVESGESVPTELLGIYVGMLVRMSGESK